MANECSPKIFAKCLFLLGLCLSCVQFVQAAQAPQSVGGDRIGTTAPTTKLQFSGGDAYASTPGNGLIIKSPDGTKCARISLNNSGGLETNPLTCP